MTWWEEYLHNTPWVADRTARPTRPLRPAAPVPRPAPRSSPVLVHPAEREASSALKQLGAMVAVCIAYGLQALARWASRTTPLEPEDAAVKRFRLLEIDR